jgi:hypothetical protein
MATTAPRLVAHPAVGSSPCLVARARRCRGRAFSIRIQGGGQRRAHRYVLQGGDDRRGAPRQSAPAGRRPSAAVDLTATTGKDIAPPVCSLPDGHGLDPLPDPDHGLDPPLGGRNRREGGGGGVRRVADRMTFGGNDGFELERPHRHGRLRGGAQVPHKSQVMASAVCWRWRR